MKRYLYILALLFIAANTSAQKSYTYIGGGLNGSAFNFDRFDAFVDNYNTSRTGANGSVALTKKMDKINFLSGYNFVWGNVNSETGLHVEFRYAMNKANTRAEAGARFREIDFIYNQGSVGMGYTMINSGIMDLIVGATAEFGAMNFHTRTDSIATVKFNDLSTGNKIYLQSNITFGFVGVGARAFYNFQWFSADVDKLDETVNTNTFQQSDKTLNYSSGFGLEASVFIMFGKKKMNTSNRVIRKS